tara:strand:- start:4136 stop:4624 length:489 start_codon:yes stop_codon:yes gene_type:complete
MANPFNFSSGDVLTAAELNSIGDWQAWTPVWNDLTIGNATVQAKYAEVNELVFYSLEMTWGSTTAATSYFEIQAPVQEMNPDVAYFPGGNAIFYNYGTALHSGTVIGYNDGTTAWLVPWWQAYNAGVGMFIYQGNCNASNPFTWTTGDVMYLAGFYERSAIT